MTETSFILDARQALREAKRYTERGSFVPDVVVRNLMARVAELITHAAGMEDNIRQSWVKRRQDDSARHRKIRVEGEIEVCSECVNSLGYNVAWDQSHGVPGYDQEATAEKILSFFDGARGRCSCGGSRGAAHDVNPPCTRLREANLLAIALRPEVPRG
jgi:hypothetical protein